MMRGRPKKTEINNFDLNNIGNYFNENKIEETQQENDIVLDENNHSIEKTDKVLDEQNVSLDQPTSEYVSQNENKELNTIEKKNEIISGSEDIIDLEGFIKIDANGIRMADVVISSVIESAFNFMGWKKEVKLLTNNEVKFFEKNLPSLKIKKNWKNIMIIYLFSKLK